MDVEFQDLQISNLGRAGLWPAGCQRGCHPTRRNGNTSRVDMIGTSFWGTGYDNNVGVVGHTPIIANTYGSGSIHGNPYGATYSGQSNTTRSTNHRWIT